MPLDPGISLQGTPIQIPGPLDSAAKMMTMKHLISQDQLNQLQMQEAQLKLQGDQAYRQWAADPNNASALSGALHPAAVGLFQQNPQAGIALNETLRKTQKEQADVQHVNFENMLSKADILSREMAPLLKQKEITPEHIVSALTNLSNQGFDVSKVELPKDTNPDTLRAWVQHGADSAISMKDRATNEHQNAVLAETKRMHDMLYSSINQSPGSLDAAAQRYRIDGSLPTNMGRGVQGAKQATDIRNRAAALDADENIAPDEARIRQLQGKATTGALGKLSSQEAMVGSFEKTFNKNVDLVLEQSKKVDRTGTPLINKWLLAGKRSIAGDPDVSSFDLYIKAAVNEYSKIVSGSMGNTALAQSEIAKVTSLLSAAQTDKQVMEVVNAMKKETANRMQGFTEQKDALRKSLGTGKTPQPSVQPSAPSTGGIKFLGFE